MNQTFNVNTELEKKVEIVSVVASEFGLIVPSEKITSIVSTLDAYECRDGDRHLVSYKNANEFTLDNYYDTTYLFGDICATRSNLFNTKMKELGLPKRVNRDAVDNLTVMSILAALTYTDATKPEGQLKIMSHFLGWLYR